MKILFLSTAIFAIMLALLSVGANASKALLKELKNTNNANPNNNKKLTGNLSISGCFPCDLFPPGADCCLAGEPCNDGTECCGTSKTDPVGCQTSCTPECGTAQCGNGGCSMLPSTTCGSCDASKYEECDLQTGTCVPAPICYECFSGHCCIAGEMCPGDVPCCASGDDTIVDCFHNCTPQCGDQQCGPGGCPNDRGIDFCGTCSDNNICSPDGYCVCPAVCDCGGSLCKGCPPLSAGCGGVDSGSRQCSCLGPDTNEHSVSLIPAKSLVYEIVTTGNACTDNYQCGGYQPINATTETPYQIYYAGEKGGDTVQNLILVFEAPNGQPFPGEDLFINFGSNSTTTEGCAHAPASWLPNLRYPPFQILISNCTQSIYPYCYSQADSRCFNRESPFQNGKCDTVLQTTTIGDGRGFWFKNPGTPGFTLNVGLYDYYYFCGGGNYFAGQIQREGITLQYVRS